MRSITKLNPLVALIPILILGMALRAYRLDFQPLWFDEGYSVYFSTMDPVTTSYLTAQDIHPPLYYYLLGVWIRVLGLNDVILRSFSVVVGTATLPVLYLAAQRLFGKTSIALIATFLLAISPMHVYYSQEVRMYGLVTLLITGSLYYFSEILLGKRKRLLYWIGFSAITILAIYTQYFAAFILASFTLFLVLFRKTHGHLIREWCLAAGGILLAFFPWAVFAGLSLYRYVGDKVNSEAYSTLNPLFYFGEPLQAFSMGNTATSVQFVSIAFIGFAAVNALVPSLRLRREGSARLVTIDVADHAGLTLAFLLVAVPLLLGWIVNLKFPFHPEYWERLFLFSLPPFLLLVAAGIEWLRERMSLALVVTLLVCTTGNAVALNAFYTTERYASNDYRPLVKAVSTLSRPNDLTLLVYPWQVGFFQTYFQGEWPSLYLVPSTVWAERPRLMASDLIQLSKAHPRIWFPAYQTLGRILESSMEEHLVTRDFPISDTWFEDTKLLFLATGKDPAEKQKLANFDDKIRLLNYKLDDQKRESGSGVINIIFNWRPIGPVQEKYKINLRLVDDKNRTWAQRDSEPGAGLSPTDQWVSRSTIEDRHGLLVPAGTPPGEYEIKVGLSSGSGNLNVLDENHAPAGQEVSLGKVTVFPSTYPNPLGALLIEHPLAADVGHGVGLLGYSGGEKAAKPGTSMRISLFWQANRDIGYQDVPFLFWFEGPDGRHLGEVQTKPADGKYSTDKWMPGELIRDQQDILLPANMPDGLYTLMVGAGTTESGVALFTIDVKDRPRSFDRPQVLVETDLVVGEFAELLGYSMTVKPKSPDAPGALSAGQDGIVRPGDRVLLTLYWHANGESGRNFTVFAHLLDPNNKMIGQLDSTPGNGTLPTTSWVEGEFLQDGHEIEVKPDASSSELRIEIGMFDAVSGQRLPIVSADGSAVGDSAIIGKIMLDSATPAPTLSSTPSTEDKG